MIKLSNKIAIVTGGSQGIGAAISQAYAAEGATVIVVNKTNVKAGQKMAEQIIHAGGKAEAIACDVTDPIAVTALVKRVNEHYGHIDILVNNAGVVVCNNIEDQTVEDWNHVIDTNLKGPFLMSKAVVPTMKKQGSGKIIFISSVAGSVGCAKIAPYSASKGGLLAMAKTMVAELAPYHINVNSISPGSTETEINRQFRSDPEFVAMLTQRTPTGRAYMQPEDIAGAAVFLASESANSIHGLDLIIDEGWCAV